MSRTEQYRAHLQQLCDWEFYLLAESRLPGSRANLELAQAVADEGDEIQFRRWLALDATAAPPNTPGEFLPLCGAIGLGRLLAEGDGAVLPALRAAAADSRWRVREGVAMALQRWGAADMDALLMAMTEWANGNRYEQRAAVAGLCEPLLLRYPTMAERILVILDGIMATVPGAADRRGDGFVALRKALGYGLSVAAVAAPPSGLALLARWEAIDDPDVRWIVRQNWAKKRMGKIAGGRGSRGEREKGRKKGLGKWLCGRRTG